MIYISDLQQLISTWQQRMDSTVYSSSYHDGVNDCIYELSQLINKTLTDELTEYDARDYLISQQADSYLSSIEAHEPAA